MIDPIALKIGPLGIRWYGIIMATAFLVGTVLACRRARQNGIDPNHILNMVTLIIPLAIIFARLYYVAFEWENYRSEPWEIIAIWHGGLAIHGGLIGGILGVYLYTRSRNLNIRNIFDILAPSLILGQAIGRWGNFINQEAHGGPVPESFISRFPDFIKDQMYIGGQYYHPTFLYESLWDLAVFAVLTWRWTKRKFQGEITLLYLVLYSLGRFFIEGLRTDSLMLGPIKVAQFISLILIIGGTTALLANYRRVKT